MTIKELRATIGALASAYEAARENGGNQDTTACKFIEAIGPEEAAQCVAAMVCRASWDGRISQAAKEWASSVALSDEWARHIEDTYCDAIHPAHLSQIAEAIPYAIKAAESVESAIPRPVWSDAIRGRRAEVWFRRSQSAWDLAARLDPVVTADSKAAAAKLLDSIQRYALADAREWERENSSERYCNSRYHKDREAMLDRRRVRLEKALAPYRCRLCNYGLYPSIVDADTRETLSFLHYFD